MTTIDNLASAVENGLTQYSREVSEAVKKAAVDEGKETVKAIRANIDSSGIDQSAGKPYRSSWKATKIGESNSTITVVVHSKDQYRLAHLLEKGHAKVNGGRTRAFPHIKPAEEEMTRRFERKLKIILKGGAE